MNVAALLQDSPSTEDRRRRPANQTSQNQPPSASSQSPEHTRQQQPPPPQQPQPYRSPPSYADYPQQQPAAQQHLYDSRRHGPAPFSQQPRAQGAYMDYPPPQRPSQSPHMNPSVYDPSPMYHGPPPPTTSSKDLGRSPAMGSLRAAHPGPGGHPGSPWERDSYKPPASGLETYDGGLRVGGPERGSRDVREHRDAAHDHASAHHSPSDGLPPRIPYTRHPKDKAPRPDRERQRDGEREIAREPEKDLTERERERELERQIAREREKELGVREREREREREALEREKELAMREREREWEREQDKDAAERERERDREDMDHIRAVAIHRLKNTVPHVHAPAPLPPNQHLHTDHPTKQAQNQFQFQVMLDGQAPAPLATLPTGLGLGLTLDTSERAREKAAREQQEIPKEPPALSPDMIHHLGTYRYPKLPFPHFFPPTLSPSRRPAPTETRTTILVPALHLPTSAPTRPRIWGGGAASAHAQTRRIYTDDSDPFLCALHSGYVSWSGAREARRAGKGCKIVLRVVRCGMRGLGDGRGGEAGELEVVWRFVGGWGAKYMGGGEERGEEDDGRSLLSAGWGTSHDGSGIEVVSAGFVDKCEVEPTIPTRSQRLHEYTARRAVICSSCPGPRKKRRRIDNSAIDEDAALSNARTIVFGNNHAGFKYDPESLSTAMFPESSNAQKKRRLNPDSDAEPDGGMAVDSDAPRTEQSTRPIILETETEQFMLSSTMEGKPGGGTQERTYTLSSLTDTKTGSVAYALAAEVREMGSSANVPQATTDAPTPASLVVPPPSDPLPDAAAPTSPKVNPPSEPDATSDKPNLSPPQGQPSSSTVISHGLGEAQFSFSKEGISLVYGEGKAGTARMDVQMWRWAAPA